MPPLSPLQRFVPVMGAADAQLNVLLIDAASEAQARVTALAGREGVGAAVRRAQYTQVRAELLKTVSGLYGGVAGDLDAGMQAAGQAAAAAATEIDSVLFAEFGPDAMPEGLAEAHRAQARDTVRQYQARLANGIPLSAQVYKTQALSAGLVDRQINLSLALGESWKELAARVSTSIEPGVRGGVAYASKRLARTEINNAFHTAQIASHQDEPWVDSFAWNLSGSHPEPDICDDLARDVHYKGGQAGHYQKDAVPQKPHPQCLCYITPETVSEDDFVSGFLNGNYDQHLDEKVYKYAPVGKRPC